MAKSTKDKAIWAENVYRDAFDRARSKVAAAGESLQREEFGQALQELEEADAQLRSLRDLLGMRVEGDGR